MSPSLRLTVIGTGYLGATHAAAMADLGFDVLGMDVDEQKVARLNAGELPFYEPELEPLLRKHLESGRLRFTTSYREVAAFGDVHFICVGTPQQPGSNAADMRYVDAVVEGLVPGLSRNALLVGKSTVPVGTATRLSERIAELAPRDLDVELAWNPEFLREGHAVQDTLRPDRLVLGVASRRAEEILLEIYAALVDDGVPLVTTDLPTAELVKVSANSFLATKISFINAMAEVCEATGADVVRLAEALSHDERIGGRFLHAGLGFGGGCLPKDIRAFMARAEEIGADEALGFLREVDTINMRRRERVVQLAGELAGGGVLGRRIGVLGAAFKPNTDDVRDSPALNVAMTLQLQGASVTVYDPEAMRSARQLFPTLRYADSIRSAIAGADVVLHLTEWTEFRQADPGELVSVVRHACIVDGRNALDPGRWRDAGWTFRALGRP